MMSVNAKWLLIISSSVSIVKTVEKSNMIYVYSHYHKTTALKKTSHFRGSIDLYHMDLTVWKWDQSVIVGGWGIVFIHLPQGGMGDSFKGSEEHFPERVDLGQLPEMFKDFCHSILVFK
jgi:hypothetical protein